MHNITLILNDVNIYVIVLIIIIITMDHSLVAINICIHIKAMYFTINLSIF